MSKSGILKSSQVSSQVRGLQKSSSQVKSSQRSLKYFQVKSQVKSDTPKKFQVKSSQVTGFRKKCQVKSSQVNMLKKSFKSCQVKQKICIAIRDTLMAWPEGPQPPAPALTVSGGCSPNLLWQGVSL